MAKLYYRYASMNAGKSTALLQVAFNYEERGKTPLLLTAAIDHRMGVGVIGSRIGLRRNAETFDENTVFTADFLKPFDCLLIDEAQFLKEPQVRQLHKLASMGDTPVICYGIRSDFLGHAFEGSAALLTLADDLQELKTICDCGKKASMNMRLSESGQKIKEGTQVVIGGNESYSPVCPRCFYNA